MRRRCALGSAEILSGLFRPPVPAVIAAPVVVVAIHFGAIAVEDDPYLATISAPRAPRLSFENGRSVDA